MSKIIQKINLEVAKPNLFQALVAKQNDSNSRFLNVTFMNHNEKIEVSQSATVTINANRPDGQSKSFAGEANEDGTATVPLTAWMLELAGALYCDVSIINAESQKLTSTKFTVMVEDAACTDEDISQDEDYDILTQLIQEVEELKENMSGGGEAQGITGEINIEDLPLGMSYALENATLQYINDGEMGTRGSLAVDSGSCIIKTMGQVFDSGCGELFGGAITVHIIPQHVASWDSYGDEEKCTVIRISPWKSAPYDTQYYVEYVGKDFRRVESLSTDPDYDSFYPNNIPSVGAVVRYINDNAEDWYFELEDGQMVTKRVVMGSWI